MLILETLEPKSEVKLFNILIYKGFCIYKFIIIKLGAFGGEKETGGGRESGTDSWK